MADWRDETARGYAKINDDLRNELIEKAWFDRDGKSNAMQQDVETSIEAYDQSVWKRLPDAEMSDATIWENGEKADMAGEKPGGQTKEASIGELYGQTPEQADAADIYGNGQGKQASIGELYGESAGQSDAADFYGHSQSEQASIGELYGQDEPEPADLYGEPERDLEQDY